MIFVRGDDVFKGAEMADYFSFHQNSKGKKTKILVERPITAAM